MKNESKNIRVVRREGGLIETNSSSSHAVSICMDAKTNLKPGDPEFDLDIRDGILYVPCRGQDFGWEWEKSNSCLTKLQYVCAFFFNQYQELRFQKSQKKLEKMLKDILGVKEVKFEWVEDYVQKYKINGDPGYLNCPSIDHQSYSDMREEILESPDTLRNFLLNPRSWWYGGNDNSDAHPGFYSETKIETPENPEAIVTADFGGDFGIIDFPLFDFPIEDVSELKYAMSSQDSNHFLNDIIWSGKEQKFKFDNNTKPAVVEDGIYHLEGTVVMDNKLYLLYYSSESYKIFLDRRSEQQKQNIKRPSLVEYEDMVLSGEFKKDTDYILVPLKLWSEEFGIIYDF